MLENKIILRKTKKDGANEKRDPVLARNDRGSLGQLVY